MKFCQNSVGTASNISFLLYPQEQEENTYTLVKEEMMLPGTAEMEQERRKGEKTHDSEILENAANILDQSVDVMQIFG